MIRAMAVFTIRTGTGDEGPLTIYQVQQRLHAGLLGADDLVREDAGEFRKVADFPAFSRLLEKRSPSPEAATIGGDDASTVTIAGVTLQRGPDGKPLPPSPEELAALLRAAEKPVDHVKLKRRVTIVAFVFAVLVGIVSWTALRRAHALQEAVVQEAFGRP